MANDTFLANLEQVESVPLDYEIPGSLELALQSVTATFDGSGAGSSFLPVLQVFGPGNVGPFTFVNPNGAVAAGDSAEVTFGTFLGGAVQAGSLSVTDGTTTVSPTSVLDFTSGATVSDGGGGTADVAISGGGGATLHYGQFQDWDTTGITIGAGSQVAVDWNTSGGGSFFSYLGGGTLECIVAGMYTFALAGQVFPSPPADFVLTVSFQTPGGAPVGGSVNIPILASGVGNQAFWVPVTLNADVGYNFTVYLSNNGANSVTVEWFPFVQQLAT